MVLQTCLSNAWGGLEMVAFETAERLSARGQDPVTVCLRNTELGRRLRERGLKVIEVDLGHKYFSWPTIQRLRQEFKSGAYSAVLIQQLRDLWFVVPALVGHSKINLVGISHSLIGVNKRDPLHRWLFQRVRSIVALTEGHKQNLLQHLPLRSDQVAVIPNGVDLNRFRPEWRDPAIRGQFISDPATLFVGIVTRIDPAKGLREAIEAADLLRQWRVPVKIAIFGRETIGEEGTKAQLEQLIKQRGLESQVEFIGHVAEIEKVVASFDVLLMPSPGETFGRVLIEAMASKVPVVACAGGGVPYIVDQRENGLLVPPGNAKAMAEALRELHGNREFRHRLGQNGWEKARTVYAHMNVTEQLFALLGV